MNLRRSLILMAVVLAFALGAFIMCLLAGCAAVSARGKTAQEIGALAASTPAALVMLDTNQMNEATALAQVQFNAQQFNAWADAATVNFFAYVFGSKELLATVGWYKHVQDNAAISTDDLRQATTRPARAAPRLKEQYRRVLILKAVIDGEKPPE